MARNTKKLLADSLRALLEEKTLDQITIKELTDNCGLNRQTFYYNFHSIYDLMAWILDESTRNALKNKTTYPSWCDMFNAIVHEAGANCTLTLNAYHSANRVDLERYMLSRYRPAMEALANDKITSLGLQLAEEDLAFAVDIFTRWIVSMLFEALDNKNKEGNQQRLGRFWHLVDSNLEHTLRTMSAAKQS